jgi:hypothetical protein
MKSERWVVAALTLILGSILGAGPIEAQVDQADLARQIAQDGPAERFGAAYHVRQMGPENADPALREVLVSAFAEEAEAFRAYWRAEGPRPDIDVVGSSLCWMGERRGEGSRGVAGRG